MAFEFKLPDIGEGVVEGEIVKWLVKAGDRVDVDQPMVEVMTDKATVVIPSPKRGVVKETRGKEGEVIQVHATLVVIDEAAPKSDPGPTLTPAPLAAHAPVAAQPVPRAPLPVAPVAPPASTAPAPASQNGGAKVLAAPATRRLAREMGVDLARVPGTGPAGRVTSDDVRRAAQPQPLLAAPAAPAVRDAPRPPAASGGDERIPVRGLRKRIWENMALSAFTAAHFTFVEECDATDLVAMRSRFNGRVREGEPKLTFLPFIVKAVISALKRFPMMNGHVDDDQMEFIRRADFHIGIAVASERGLIVPVVRNADRRSIMGLQNEIMRLADAVRSNRLTQDDLGGSTFTITSLGKEGGIFATPIINYPEVAIMGVHKLTRRPMVSDDDQIVIREMMNLSLSFDHRLIDGHIGAAFTYAVIDLLQNPDRLMMEMA
jgi:pyruvate dehydrogenase E2 component (dihydrolipoamide acetyltransferase)